MKKILYMEPLFSKRRLKLIELCGNLQREGKNFIYILPSREAIRDVRYKLLDMLGGIIGSKITMFDELEESITEAYVPQNSIIQQDIEKMLLTAVCKEVASDLLYFKKICLKKGFIEETLSFIKNLKRSMISEEKLELIKKNIKDEILKDKVHDLHLLYSEYNKSLSSKGLYDVNDISVLAVDKVEEYEVLDKIYALVIDGFINIDKVNLALLKKIAESKRVDIYVNCPYKNKLTEDFVKLELLEPFKAMNFEVSEEPEELYETCEEIRELSNKLFSGERMSLTPQRVAIGSYPCISAEVRETARDIKGRIIKGESPEDIAVFVNNSSDYSGVMRSIFNEYKLPLSMVYKLPLADGAFGRELIKLIGTIEAENTSAEKWLNGAAAALESHKEELISIIDSAFNTSLSYEDKLHAKVFEGLYKLNKEMQRAYELSGLTKSTLNKEEFLRDYREYLTEATITIEKPHNGGIKILNTDLAKGVYYNHVYILGLNEGEIPKVIKNDGLFNEFEVAALKAFGIQYEDYLWELSREKIRFNLTLAAAKESLALSYRSSDEAGKFAIASSLLEEVKYISGLKESTVMNMRQRFEIPYESTMSAYELRALHLKRIFNNKYKGIEDATLEAITSIVEKEESSILDYISKALVEYHREREKEFNNYEGSLVGKVEGILIDKGAYSPSRLTTYFNCPFKYMLQHVFKLEERVEEEEELSAMEIGDFYHKVLYVYYKDLENFEDIDENRFKEAVKSGIRGLRELNVDKETLEALLNQLVDTVRNFISCDLKRIKSFEKDRKTIIRPLILEEFVTSSLFGVPINSRIDRIDLELEKVQGEYIPTGRYVVYDYKKKSIPDIDKILSKEDCQLAFYHYFAEELVKERLNLREVDCMALFYLSVEKSDKSIKKTGLYRSEYKKALDMSRASFDMSGEIFYAFLEYVKGLIEESISSINQGHFPYKVSCDCFEKFSFTSCEFKEVCRYSKRKMTVLAEV
jgi:ATP-dependent helicase/nuclease subunit B